MNVIQSLPEVHSVRRIQTSFNQAPQQFGKKNGKTAKKAQRPNSQKPKQKQNEQ